MPGWLQKLRNKSPKTRQRIALGTSISVTCLIFVMWVTVLNYGVDNEVESLQASVGQTQAASPLSAFSGNAVSAFKQLKNGITSPGESEKLSTPEGDGSDDGDKDKSFWSNQRSGGEVFHEQSREERVSTSTGDEEEFFTSRNYNPSQESGWFSQD